jgi:hypothetical protein
MRVCVCVCVCVCCVCVCVCVCEHTLILCILAMFVCICVYVHTYVYLCICICMFMHIYVCVCIHVICDDHVYQPFATSQITLGREAKTSTKKKSFSSPCVCHLCCKMGISREKYIFACTCVLGIIVLVCLTLCLEEHVVGTHSTCSVQRK